MGFRIVEIPVVYQTEESKEYDKIVRLTRKDNSEDEELDGNKTVEEILESLSIGKVKGVLINIDNIGAIEYYMKDGEPIKGYCFLCLPSEDYIVNMDRDELYKHITRLFPK